MEDLKKKGLWFVCADMDGDVMYDVNMKGPIGLVIGNEGEGVGRLVKDTCDFTARIPMVPIQMLPGVEMRQPQNAKWFAIISLSRSNSGRKNITLTVLDSI